MNKVLIAPTTFGKISNKPIQLLKENNFELIFNDKKRKLTKEELTLYLEDCVGVIAGTELYDENVLKNNHTLRAISRLGVGLENIKIDLINSKKISLIATETTPELAVSELTIGLILNLARKINKSNNDIKKGIWNKQMGQLLSRKTIGIVGLGKIGKKLINLLKGFDLEFIVYDVNPDVDFCKLYNCKISTLNDLLTNSDIVSVHINSSKKNLDLFSDHEFNLMKPSSLFINTSRGDVLNEESLVNAIESKKISGAALDVFKEEPYHGKLINYDNIILTSHIGAYAEEIRNQMEIESANNLIKLLHS